MKTSELEKKNQSWNENSGILQQLSIWIQRPAASCRVRLVFMTFHSLSPNEASAARQISTVQESKVMHSIQDSFLLNAHFHWCWSVSYSWLTKVMDHLSYWLFIVYFSSWQIGWQQDPFQLYIYWCSRPNRVVISLMIPPLISSYWLTHLSCQYLMCYTQQLLHTHCSIGPFKTLKNQLCQI